MLKHIAIIAAIAATPLYAQRVPAPTPVAGMAGTITQSSGYSGEMIVTMPADAAATPVEEVLRFEPWQMLDDLFRDDIVLLMRHGPTDWSMRDTTDVAPTDCANQRVMTDEGKSRMRQLGTLLVANEIVPGRIAVSEWCRNQETLDALSAGMTAAMPGVLDDLPIDILPDLNLLLSLQGAPNVTGMRDLITGWDGGDGTGPLLIISHYTNIAELTDFSVYEGEMLVIDPKRDNRVLGYLRLKSAAPDIGHFDATVVEGSDEYIDQGN